MRRAAGTAFLLTFIAVTTAANAGPTMLHVRESRRIVLRGAAANVIVGDPTVADVAVLDAHSIILLGRGQGATDVVVTDRAGRTLLDDHITVTGAEGVVTLHRGASTVEYSCLPRCQALSNDGGADATSRTGSLQATANEGDAGAASRANGPLHAPTPAP